MLKRFVISAIALLAFLTFTPVLRAQTTLQSRAPKELRCQQSLSRHPCGMHRVQRTRS